MIKAAAIQIPISLDVRANRDAVLRALERLAPETLARR